jgi:hypothetical protein
MEALAAAAPAALERELREPPLLERLVAARIAFVELRTPADPALLDAPPAAPIELEPAPADAAEDVEATVLELDELDEELLELELELDADDWVLPPPPPPRLPPPPPPRPIAAPPPPAKLRLPRNCGPITVENFSGPVVPVSRCVRVTLPAATGDERTTAVAARRAASASSARFF